MAAAVEVYGWAEPGTAVSVNGRNLPVARDGLFIESVPTTREGALVVEAQHEKGAKRIVRSFKRLFE